MSDLGCKPCKKVILYSALHGSVPNRKDMQDFLFTTLKCSKLMSIELQKSPSCISHTLCLLLLDFIHIQIHGSFSVHFFLFYLRFNGQAEAGIKSIDDIHFRASYELYTQVLLVSQLYNINNLLSNFNMSTESRTSLQGHQGTNMQTNCIKYVRIREH